MALKTIKVISLQRVLLYLVFIVGFFGPAFFLIDLGIFHLFPFRILLLALWFVFLLYIFFNQGKLNISHIKVKHYLWFLAIWVFYAILSLGWVNSLTDAVRQIIFLIMGASMIVFAVWHFTKLEDFKRLYYIWLLVLLPMIGLGLWNHLTGQHLAGSALVDVLGPGRFAPTAVFRNQNDFASYLALSIPFILVFIRYAKNKIMSLLGVGILLPTLYLLIITFSRVNYLAVILGIVFWVLFLFKLKGKIKVAILSILLVFLLFAIFPNYLENITGNIETQMRSLVAGIEQPGASVYIRINLIRNSFIFLWQHLGFGVGAGNVEYHMAHFQTYNTHGILNVHNWWVEILANYGILIFVGFMVFYLSLFAKLYRAYSKLINASEKMICEALLVGLVVFFLAGMGPSSIIAFSPMWIFFAFALGFLNYYRLKQVKKNNL